MSRSFPPSFAAKPRREVAESRLKRDAKVIYLEEEIVWHRKFLKAGARIPKGGVLAALGLYAAAIGYARQHFTNGRVDDEFLATFPPTTGAVSVARVLASRGIRLWHRVKGGYQIHDFLDHNVPAEKAKHQRELARRRKAAERARKAAAKAAEPATRHDVTHRVTRDIRCDLARARGTPLPLVPLRTRTAAALPRRSQRDSVTPRTVAVVTAIVTKDVLPLRLADEDLVAATERRCAQLRVGCNATVVRKAIDSALFRYYRALRLGADLPPDPRGLYHDHVRPKTTRRTA
jgi:hypothetical protein